MQHLGIDIPLLTTPPSPPPFWRKHTSSYRGLPSALIIGAQKAGTTSLAAWLATHPSIKLSFRKELYFFNNSTIYRQGVDYYKAFFPWGKGFYIDASANYFESPQAVNRIYQHLPSAKIILLLRNPIHRAYSHYQMAKRGGWEKYTFKDALAAEEERIAWGEKVRLQWGDHNYMFQKIAYRTKGIYADFMDYWLHVFPKNQLHIIESESMFTHSQNIYTNILDFLQIKEYGSQPLFIPLNVSDQSQHLPDGIAHELAIFYRPHNLRLGALLRQEMSWMAF